MRLCLNFNGHGNNDRWAPMIVRSLPALATLLASSAALAIPCFTITDRTNTTTYQSSDTPIDLSYRISDEMNRKYPGQHLVMSNVPSCPVVDSSRSVADTRFAYGVAKAKPGLR